MRPTGFQLRRENVEKPHVTLALFLYLLLGGFCPVLSLWTAASAAITLLRLVDVAAAAARDGY